MKRSFAPPLNPVTAPAGPAPPATSRLQTMRPPHALLRLALALSLAAAARAECSGSQSYVLSVNTFFTRATLALLPAKSSIPVIVAVAHSPSYSLFAIGDKLRDSVAEVIRTGRTDDLKRELDGAKLLGRGVESYSFFDEPGVNDLSQLEIKVKDASSRISLIAPLMPSPFWYAGIDSLDLCAGGSFVSERAVSVKNFQSGLDKASSWDANPDPYLPGKNIAVNSREDPPFARLSVKKGTLGVDWWKICLGVLSGVAVLVVMVLFVLPRLRKKKPTELPLTAQDGVEW